MNTQTYKPFVTSKRVTKFIDADGRFYPLSTLGTMLAAMRDAGAGEWKPLALALADAVTGFYDDNPAENIKVNPEAVSQNQKIELEEIFGEDFNEIS